MFKKHTLTVIELKLLLLARFNAEQSKQAELQARLQRELGNEVQEEKPEVIAIKNKLVDWICDVLAYRLKQNRYTTPLLLPRDFVRFVPLMINEIAKAKGDKLGIKECKMIERFTETMFENIYVAVHAMVPPHNNPYEEHWRWVMTVLDLASERGVMPTELFALEGVTDEITRRMFAKEQFVALFKRAANKFVDADVLKKMVFQPMFDMVADEEERRKLEQEFESEIMPQLRETVEKTKVVINAFLGEEVERIYAAA